jgi:transposase
LQPDAFFGRSSEAAMLVYALIEAGCSPRKSLLACGYLLADKAYDADSLIKLVRETGAKVCILPKSNRLDPHDYDKALDKERNQVERIFANSKSSDVSRPDRTNLFVMSWALQNSPLCIYGAND